ncbi:hypothetical protein FIBSPDRAFT_535116 [Athelia psychrophila]|uniref:Uncharacterized protein n=1 Tax=Athelia psychrophila TaxID=1759441 RepID=A0A166J4E7_9AGAM|nr:hypothetical protein FIBSPDRAFT_535116 [Fibularhizoctonia sp. CBS 109695]
MAQWQARLSMLTEGSCSIQDRVVSQDQVRIRFCIFIYICVLVRVSLACNASFRYRWCDGAMVPCHVNTNQLSS